MIDIAVIRLDQISSLLANHVHRVLDAAVRDDRDDGSVDNTEVLDSVDLELRVYHSLVDVLRQAVGAARMESSLAAIQNSVVHRHIIVQGHLPGVFTYDDVLEAFTLGKDIITEPDTFSHGNDVKVIGEEVQVDVRLHEWIRAVESHLAGVRDRAHQVNDRGHIATLLRNGIVPLEGATEHTDEVKFEVWLSVWAKWVLAPIRGLCLTVFRVSFQILVDARETHELQKTRAHRTGVVFLIGAYGSLVLGSRSQKDIVHAVAILDLQDEGPGWSIRF